MKKREVSVLNTQSGDSAEDSWHSDWTLDKNTCCVGREKEGHEKWKTRYEQRLGTRNNCSK